MGSEQGDRTRNASGLGPSEDSETLAREPSTMSAKRLPLTMAVLLGLLSVPMSMFLILVAVLAGAEFLHGYAAIVIPVMAGFVLLMLISYAVAKLLKLAEIGLDSLRALGLALNIVLVPAMSAITGLGALAVLELRSSPMTKLDGGLLADLALVGIPVLASYGVAAILAAGVSRECRLGASPKTSARLAVLAGTGWALVLVGALVLRSMLVLLLAPVLLAWLGVRQMRVLKRTAPIMDHASVAPPATAPLAVADQAASRKDRPTMARRVGKIAILLGVAFLSAYAGFLVGLNAQPAQAATAGPPESMVRVIFAGQEIPAGEVITRDMAIPVPYPEDLIVETMMTSLDEVLGREARYDIARGMPITEGMLGPALTPTGAP